MVLWTRSRRNTLGSWSNRLPDNCPARGVQFNPGSVLHRRQHRRCSLRLRCRAQLQPASPTPAGRYGCALNSPAAADLRLSLPLRHLVCPCCMDGQSQYLIQRRNTRVMFRNSVRGQREVLTRGGSELWRRRQRVEAIDPYTSATIAPRLWPVAPLRLR